MRFLRKPVQDQEMAQEIIQKNRRLCRLRQQLEERDRKIAELQAKLAGNEAAAKPDGIGPENIVWIFGAGRTGSTWLAAMMKDLPDHRIWFEPRVGSFFDPNELSRVGGTNYVFASAYKETWLGNIRRLVLDDAATRFPAGTEVLVVKEPGGSVGAPLLMDALPESRMILLIRDPRDVVASWVDAVGKNAWAERRSGALGALSSTDPLSFAQRHAEVYLRHVGNAAKAFEAHQGRKVLVKYEDLRADTLGEMRRIYASLEMSVNEDELARVVEKHSWENIPEENKGEGKFYRKATPGGWKEDLSPKQVEIVESITAPLLREFYPDREGCS